MKSVRDEDIEILEPLQPEDVASLARLDRVARLLDSQWRIPGTKIRIGLDALVGLVPGIGDVAAGGVATWIVWHAARHGAPPHLLARMIGNVALDTIFGSIPVAGSIFDVFYRANNRNVRLLIRHLEKTHGVSHED